MCASILIVKSLTIHHTPLSDTKAILCALKHVGQLTTQRRNQIIKCLATRYDRQAAVIRRILPSELECWGKVKISGGGDMIHAAELVQEGGGRRDASYVRVSNTILP